ncbi:MAG: helix-turn-helix transcriptional regulator [Clostridia bacterium]|nr:helix-turn-helix transcriptional regulator [Clostridia bacterium]
MDFGTKLRMLIEEKDITQKELALQLNIAPSTVSSYVQNTREPDFATLRLISKYFDVSLDYLLGGTDTVTSQQEDELLRVFRSLTAEEKEICIEQCKVFIRMRYRNEKK